VGREEEKKSDVKIFDAVALFCLVTVLIEIKMGEVTHYSTLRVPSPCFIFVPRIK